MYPIHNTHTIMANVVLGLPLYVIYVHVQPSLIFHFISFSIIRAFTGQISHSSNTEFYETSRQFLQGLYRKLGSTAILNT
jgi:hypothetical protein